MRKTRTTKRDRLLWFIFSFLSIIAFIGPACFFIAEAFITTAIVSEKIVLMTSVIVVLIMTLIVFVNKVAMRSRIWILLIAMYICLDNFIFPLFLIGGCQIVDEIILTPLKKHFKNLYTINKEIDRRN